MNGPSRYKTEQQSVCKCQIQLNIVLMKMSSLKTRRLPEDPQICRLYMENVTATYKNLKNIYLRSLAE